ncbi:EamA family transporter [Piscinibacterium candidicorallinum]|jgi:O-acetylserine/cysteine efflux transporter|uniref:EamA family transporter n=1 Tax=Piscinibacterium candidicorallinum TaxID=1793872 RepID=A0ABV7H9Y5_9BURK
MSAPHALLALLVVFVWGTNFVVIKLGLADFPPMLLATLRFAASALPWLFFIKRPAVPWALMSGIGTLAGLQFGLLFAAMRADITPGLASLLIQTQVFMTIGLSMVMLRERLHRLQWVGLAFGVAALGLLLSRSGGAADLTLLGVALVLAAALAWSVANVLARRLGKVDMLAFMVWSSLFAVPPLLGLSLWLDGWTAIASALAHASLVGWLAVGWQALGNTLFGFGVWNWLLTQYPAAQVTPMALLVPVFGLSASALALGEPLQSWKLLAALLIMAGLALNVWAGRLRSRALQTA